MVSLDLPEELIVGETRLDTEKAIVYLVAEPVIEPKARWTVGPLLLSVSVSQTMWRCQINLKWNQFERRFEAELSRDNFQIDLEAAKEAGFKTDGAPAWIWYSIKAMPLKWLREHRPPMLTIEADARVEYERLLPVEENNARLKTELQVHKKALKKTLDREKRQGELRTLVIPHKPDELFDYIGAEDLPPMPPFEKQYVSPPPPDVLCIVCKSPVYPYEYAEGTENSACLWCQKKGELYS